MERDFGANRFFYFDLRRISVTTAVEHKSAFLSGTNRQCDQTRALKPPCVARQAKGSQGDTPLPKPL
jgi:hypothetical protein